MGFADEHDWKRYPELTNSELEEFGLLSPHVQITGDFRAVVVRVHDGDTVTLKCDFRDFEFPLRLGSIDAPELNTGAPGLAAKEFLEGQVLGEEVQVRIDPKNRVEKYGRLLGEIEVCGINVAEMMICLGFVSKFENRREELIPEFDAYVGKSKWF